MKKILITTGFVLSTILLHGQTKKKYNFSAGTMVGAPYSSNYGAWVNIGKVVGFEYTQGTVNNIDLFPSPTKYTNIGFNLHYFKKFFLGGGIQTLNSEEDKSSLPYVNLGINQHFGKNDIFVIRGEVMSGGKGITTLNIGIGINL